MKGYIYIYIYWYFSLYYIIFEDKSLHKEQIYNGWWNVEGIVTVEKF